MTAHKFRIAFCILCHKYTPVLEELIRILNVPGNEIFIHVDGKSRIQDFAPLRDRTGVTFSRTEDKSLLGRLQYGRKHSSAFRRNSK